MQKRGVHWKSVFFIAGFFLAVILLDYYHTSTSTGYVITKNSLDQPTANPPVYKPTTTTQQVTLETNPFETVKTKKQTFSVLLKQLIGLSPDTFFQQHPSGGSGGPPAPSQTCSSITMYSTITFTFDQPYPCGYFANGDPWVGELQQGQGVTITGMTPDYDSSAQRNGWMSSKDIAVNVQGYDGRLSSSFTWAEPRAKPTSAQSYRAQAGESIVKAVSYAGSYGGQPCDTQNTNPAWIPCLQTAAGLTIVDVSPPNNGATVLRPYYPTMKSLPIQYHDVSQLQTQLLPSLGPVAAAPTLQQVARACERPHIFIGPRGGGSLDRPAHPIDNMIIPSTGAFAEYGVQYGAATNEMVLRLLLNDPISTKMDALIKCVQVGMDTFALAKYAGVTWSVSGGQHQGRKILPVLAATMLNDQEMITYLSATPASQFHEDHEIWYGPNAQNILWTEGSLNEAQYWGYMFGGENLNTYYYPNYPKQQGGDPNGWIDGSAGGQYQSTGSKNPAHATLALEKMPSLKVPWGQQRATDAMLYADRWQSVGAWTQPDPCAPPDPRESSSCNPLRNPGACQYYKVTWGPNPAKPGECILDQDLNFAAGASFTNPICQTGKQCGRYPFYHGVRPSNQGGTIFTDNMWNTYHISGGSGSKQCGDLLDNDNDGWTDYPADPGCTSATDDDESNSNLGQCADNIDNDADTFIDGGDPMCTTWQSPTEKAQCQDGLDNDNDLKIDYPADPGCTDANDNDEQNPAAAQLITWLSFLEGTGATTFADLAAGINPGSCTGTTCPVTTKAGLIGNGVLFDGIDDLIQMGTNRWNKQQGTVSFWIYPTSFPSDTNYFIGHTTVPAWNNQIQLYTDDPTGQLDLGLGLQSHTTATNIQQLIINKWQHITLTWNNGQYNVYIDGQLKRSGSYTNLAQLNSFVHLGNSGNPSSNEPLRGIMDEVIIFDGAITPPAIQTIMALTYGGGPGAATLTAVFPATINGRSPPATIQLQGSSFPANAQVLLDDKIVYPGITVTSSSIITIPLPTTIPPGTAYFRVLNPTNGRYSQKLLLTVT